MSDPDNESENRMAATRSATGAAKAPRKASAKSTKKKSNLALVSKQRAEPKYMPLDEVGRFVETLPTEYLQCRELNHQWQPHAARRTSTGFERTLLCPRCDAEKQQTLDSRGHPVGSPKYVYPEGYQNTGHGRISGSGRDAVRLASITRLID